MKSEDPTPIGRFPENAVRPAEATARAPSKPQDTSAPVQNVPGSRPEPRPRKRKKPFVL